MSLVWDKMIPLTEEILKRFDTCLKLEVPEIYKGDERWTNHLFASRYFRRAHVQIVDARESKKIWVLHMTIFPFFDDPAPVFGFDIVCGANKITGAFHDFSKMGDSEEYNWYLKKMEPINWTKERELPPWAKEIFSPQMLAVGNITTEEELDKLIAIGIDNLDYYLYNVGTNRNSDWYLDQYNKYCRNQKMNPHTPAMMTSLGIDETLFKNFMDEIQFPEFK